MLQIVGNLQELHEISAQLVGSLEECIEMSAEERERGGPQAGFIFEEIAEVNVLLVALIEFVNSNIWRLWICILASSHIRDNNLHVHTVVYMYCTP